MAKSPKVSVTLRYYKDLNPDEMREFQDELLNPDQSKMATDDQEPSSWADMASLLGPITWAWKPWLPNGMLTILAGESGAGKSMMVLRLAGCFLLGWPWADGSPFTGETGDVLWCESEAAQAVNFERAVNWGLPLERLRNPLDPLMDVKLDEPSHLAMIYERAFRPNIRLVIVDSLRAANSKDENSSEVMGVVVKVAELARDTGKPVILTHHLRKRGIFDGDSVDLERLRGSSSIVQTARVIWAMDTPDQQNKDRKRLQVIKSNLSRFPEPVGMAINDLGVNFGQAPEAPRVESAIDRAIDLLRALLGDAPMPYDEIEQEIKQAGISQATINRAKKKLGIISRKEREGWTWGLPQKREYTD